MKVLRFNLKGNTAFFKSNAWNDMDTTYSYGHIHKVALLGMLGAILGLGGHTKAHLDKGSKYIHPEFYELLNGLQIGIIPNANKGSFVRKKQGMVNTCGCNTGTLMYTEQWLYNVDWDIFINLDSIDKEIADKLEDYIVNNKAVYMPYLGKTNHFAEISSGCIVKGRQLSSTNVKIASLFPLDDDSIIIQNGQGSLFNKPKEQFFEYRERLPYAYSDDNCIYKQKIFVLTNKNCNVSENTKLVNVEDLNIYFY